MLAAWENVTINIGIGLVIVGLVKYIFNREKGLLMSKEQHTRECKDAQKDMEDVIKNEFSTFKEHFDTEMELKVMRSLHNLNGTLEQKIADVVSAQVKLLGAVLTDEINKKLDLVEILKHVVKKSD